MGSHLKGLYSKNKSSDFQFLTGSPSKLLKDLENSLLFAYKTDFSANFY